MKYIIIAFWSMMLAATASVAQSDYRIKSGDTLSVEVLEDAQLNRQLLVLPDGSITFPFAGNIRASGRTVSDVQAAIRSGIASNFAAEPTVFVTVASLRPRDPVSAGGPSAPETIDIYITGEVSSPGSKQVKPGTTFLQAMAQSGGFSNFAATKRVQLRRTNAATGQQSTFVINYKALARGARLSNEIYLQEGDVILVPERRLFE